MMHAILFVMKEAGVRNVPSFYRLRKIQAQLRAESGIPTIKCQSPLGNIFYLNDPLTIIGRVRF